MSGIHLPLVLQYGYVVGIASMHLEMPSVAVRFSAATDVLFMYSLLRLAGRQINCCITCPLLSALWHGNPVKLSVIANEVNCLFDNDLGNPNLDVTC